MNPVSKKTKSLAIMAIAGAILGMGAGFGLLALAKDDFSPRSVNLTVEETPIKRNGTMPRSFSEIVKSVTPSVVRITTVGKSPAIRPEMNPFGGNPLLERFFGPNQRFYSPEMPPQRGLGSGVIVSEDGYILTNNHVVEEADEIQVFLGDDDREYEAKLIGADPKSDLAILKINAANLPYARIGNSDLIEVGDIVLAVGNPFGVGQTVTMGIVSATGRATLGLDYEDFIQTDAAINPGNSGGALVDVEGRLIGINTAILSKTGANQGIGFAIPTNLARNVMEDLIEQGYVNRGFLGVMIQDVSPGLADYFDLNETKGALITEVTENSPANRAGLEVGDLILEFNETPIKDSRHLKLEIGASKPDTEHDFKVLRDGTSKSFSIVLSALNDNGLRMASSDTNPAQSSALEGVTVDDLRSSSMQLPRNLEGALVIDVERESAAWRAGLRAGDVIREINRNPITSADDAVKVCRSLDEKLILLRVWRNGQPLFIAVDESKVG